MSNKTTDLDSIPEFGTWSTAKLVDHLGILRRDRTAIEQEEAIIKDILKTRIEAGETGQGKEFDVTHQIQERKDIDRKVLKDAYGEDWYNEHCTVNEVHMLRVSTHESEE